MSQEKVREHYPQAGIESFPRNGGKFFGVYESKGSAFLLGNGRTEDKAWTNAWKVTRLNKGIRSTA